MTVPTAMLWAARSIHHSPLPHNEKLPWSKASEGTFREGPKKKKKLLSSNNSHTMQINKFKNSFQKSSHTPWHTSIISFRNHDSNKCNQTIVCGTLFTKTICEISVLSLSGHCHLSINWSNSNQNGRSIISGFTHKIWTRRKKLKFLKRKEPTITIIYIDRFLIGKNINIHHTILNEIVIS